MSRTHKIILFMTRSAIFGAIATILYVVPGLQFKVPFAPSFLEIHLDEIPNFVAGFAYGPLVALTSIFIKTIIKFPMTSTMCVGELTDLFLSIVFIIPAVIIYKYRRKFKWALLGLLVGTILQLFFALIINIYISVPFYAYLFGLDLSMIQETFPYVTNLDWSYGFYIALPFNALKDAIVVVATLLIYKIMRRTIEKIANAYHQAKLKKAEEKKNKEVVVETINQEEEQEKKS